VIERNWKEMFAWLYAEYMGGQGQGFVFPLTIHPQSSGKPHVLAMHERFIAWLKDEWSGVEFVTCAAVARDFRGGRLRGAVVDCGGGGGGGV